MSAPQDRDSDSVESLMLTELRAELEMLYRLIDQSKKTIAQADARINVSTEKLGLTRSDLGTTPAEADLDS